jgi:hypothetical protein
MNRKGFMSALLVTVISLLLLTSMASGAWVLETVDSDGFVGEDTSIALDSSGNAHISYWDRTNDREGGRIFDV